jgi:hypothetical protein
MVLTLAEDDMVLTSSGTQSKKMARNQMRVMVEISMSMAARCDDSDGSFSRTSSFSTSWSAWKRGAEEDHADSEAYGVGYPRG